MSGNIETLEAGYIEKGRKTKLGGNGNGGIYRCRRTGKDYLVKRVSSKPTDNPVLGNFRSFDEVLASRLLAAAGGSVPIMHLVYNKQKQAFVASERLLGAHDLGIEEFDKLPSIIREKILSEQVIHAWLCNRDTVNANGENFVIDQDKQVFHVDLGACLLSGFRAMEGVDNLLELRDKENFLHKSPVDLLPGECEQKKFGKLKTQQKLDYDMFNKDILIQFFKTDAETQRDVYLKGVLQILQISDEHLKQIIDASPHRDEDKKIILQGLKDRRELLVQHAHKKYGAHALQEQVISLQLQRIMHKAGIFSEMPSSIRGDAHVSWRSQYENALKPNIKITDYNVLIDLKDTKDTKIKLVIEVLKELDIQCDMDGSEKIKITELLVDLEKKLKAAVIADGLQILLGSYDFKSKGINYKSPYKSSQPYKGSCSNGFRPVVVITEEKVKNQQQAEIEFNEKIIPAKKFKFLLKEKYDLSESADYKIESNKIIIFDANKLFALVNKKIGARKTALVSENKAGQVMAGRLIQSTKGVNGFATAGGNSDRPMHPQQAAAEEGRDEFGHFVDEKQLIPMGSTVATGVSNLFLAPAGATEDKSQAIGYQEFKNESIRYYSFEEFREAYEKEKVKFDRSSIHYYVKFRQREIQQQLQAMGFDDVIVICSKKPESLGQVYLKPSIANLGSIKSIKKASELESLLRERGIQFQVIEKDSRQSKADAKEVTIIKRKIYKLDPSINPLVLLECFSTARVSPPVKGQGISFKAPKYKYGDVNSAEISQSLFDQITVGLIKLLAVVVVSAFLELIVSGVMALITHTTVLAISVAMGPSIIGFAALLLLLMGIIYYAHKVSSEKSPGVIEPVSSFAPRESAMINQPRLSVQAGKREGVAEFLGDPRAQRSEHVRDKKL